MSLITDQKQAALAEITLALTDAGVVWNSDNLPQIANWIFEYQAGPEKRLYNRLIK